MEINVVENNSGKSFAIQVGFSPVPELSVVQNYMVGPELTGSNDSIRHVWDTIVTYNHDDNLSFLVNYDYGRETGAFPTDPDQAWQGIAGYVRYAFNDKVAVASRLEWFQDDDGWSTGTQQQVKEFTQTFEYKLAGDLLSRFESSSRLVHRACLPEGREPLRTEPDHLPAGIRVLVRRRRVRG